MEENSQSDSKPSSAKATPKVLSKANTKPSKDDFQKQQQTQEGIQQIDSSADSNLSHKGEEIVNSNEARDKGDISPLLQKTKPYQVIKPSQVNQTRSSTGVVKKQDSSVATTPVRNGDRTTKHPVTGSGERMSVPAKLPAKSPNIKINTSMEVINQSEIQKDSLKVRKSHSDKNLISPQSSDIEHPDQGKRETALQAAITAYPEMDPKNKQKSTNKKITIETEESIPKSEDQEDEQQQMVDDHIVSQFRESDIDTPHMEDQIIMNTLNNHKATEVPKLNLVKLHDHQRDDLDKTQLQIQHFDQDLLQELIQNNSRLDETQKNEEIVQRLIDITNQMNQTNIYLKMIFDEQEGQQQQKDRACCNVF